MSVNLHAGGERYRCPDCGEDSPSTEWEYTEQGPTPNDYEWWWTCPRCGAETPNYPDGREVFTREQVERIVGLIEEEPRTIDEAIELERRLRDV